MFVLAHAGNRAQHALPTAACSHVVRAECSGTPWANYALVSVGNRRRTGGHRLNFVAACASSIAETPRLVLGLDIGTSGVKVGLVDEAGCVLFSAYSVIERSASALDRIDQDPGSHADPGVSEQRPQDWLLAVQKVISESKAFISQNVACRPSGIVVTGHMQDLILVGQDGEILLGGVSIMYDDTRAREQAAELSRRLGQVVSASDLLPKLMYAKEHGPDRGLQRVQHALFGAHDYVCFILSGGRRAVSDIVTLCTTGLLDSEQTDFDYGRMAAALQMQVDTLREIMPEIVSPHDPIGTVAADVALGLFSWPELAQLPVYHALGDAGATCFGSGCVSRNDDKLHCYIGTSGWIGGSFPVLPPLGDLPSRDEETSPASTVFELAHPDDETSIVLASMTTAGGAFAWACEMFGIPPSKGSLEAATQSRPGAGDVLFLPYIRGERCPFRDSGASGAFLNLRATTTRADMLRACMEGVAFNFRAVFEALQARTGSLIDSKERLRLVGGGAVSALWADIISATLNTELEVLDDPGLVAIKGAAYCVFGSNRQLSKVERDVESSFFAGTHTIVPKAAWVHIYDARYKAFIEAKNKM
ncbi:D-xylulose kinase [Porphyridium purpureum]|uniref:D-xylulose kinase n=1 Tax=Porphyridium purpureum TaxID=35688 RepID=A0A5J4YTF3_PORPP|nr:D-xylulose kinase [Porphyridium purpureum]|eukprot:POR3553..scf227_4